MCILLEKSHSNIISMYKSCVNKDLQKTFDLLLLSVSKNRIDQERQLYNTKLKHNSYQAGSLVYLN